MVDSIGKLFGLYRYADIAMVGGGFSAGVHNVLEAAVWGAPVIVGPNHKRSAEVTALIEAGGAFGHDHSEVLLLEPDQLDAVLASGDEYLDGKSVTAWLRARQLLGL